MLEHADVVTSEFAANSQTLKHLGGPLEWALVQLDALNNLCECQILIETERSSAAVWATVLEPSDMILAEHFVARRALYWSLHAIQTDHALIQTWSCDFLKLFSLAFIEAEAALHWIPGMRVLYVLYPLHVGFFTLGIIMPLILQAIGNSLYMINSEPTGKRYLENYMLLIQRLCTPIKYLIRKEAWLTDQSLLLRFARKFYAQPVFAWSTS